MISIASAWMIGLSALFVVLFAPLAWMKSRSTQRTLKTLDELPTEPLIVVLGCPVLSPRGERNRYFDARIEAAAAAYHAAASQAAAVGREPTRILCSGWDAHGEATEMVEALVRTRVPNDRIGLDRDAARTLDTIDFVATRFSAEPILFVSQAFHLPRILFLARRRGLNAWALPAEGTLRGLRPHSREALARLRALLDVGLTREPARPTSRDRSRDPS